MLVLLEILGSILATAFTIVVLLMFYKLVKDFFE